MNREKPDVSKTPEPDGLTKKDIKKIRAAIRQIWHRSGVRKKVVKRASIGNDFFRCEKCSKRVPKICIDHIKKVGEIDGGFIERLFCASTNLQALCRKCHNLKTKEERDEARFSKAFDGLEYSNE